MNTYTQALYAILALLAIVFVASRIIKGTGSTHQYRATKLMTDNELEFFRRLSAALPDAYIFPQVAMSALICPIATDQKTRLGAFRQISQKRVDWVIYSRTMQLVCVVELDDRTHNARNDAIRDAALMTAGITTIRWDSRKKPSVQEIKTRIDYYFARP